MKIITLNKKNRLLKLFPLLFLLFTFSSLSAQFTINESLRGNSANSLTIGGTAVLTSGTVDPLNDGWLRLTPDQMEKVGWAYVNQSFPSGLGVTIEFDFTAWRRSAKSADGFSVFLFDASTKNFKIGAPGGSLGYAQRFTPTTDSMPGLTGGFFGVGIDEFGNYARATEGRVGGISQNLVPNAISVRGTEKEKYKYLAGTMSLSEGVAYDSTISKRPSASQFYRRLRIEMEPINNSYQITVYWKTSQTGTFKKIAGPYVLTETPPPYLKIGFAGSTGYSINNHEVRNLFVTTPGNPRIDKSVDLRNAAVGQQLTYYVNATNGNNATLNNLIVNDTLKRSDGSLLPLADFKIDSIIFNNNGNTANTAANYPHGVKVVPTANYFKTTVSLAPNSTGTFKIVGTILKFPEGGIVSNTARIDPVNSGITDIDLTNNSFTVNTQVISPKVDFHITKTVNKACSDLKGNIYNIVVSNVGATKPGGANFLVTVKDTIPAGFTVDSTSTLQNSGWNVLKDGNIYTFTRSNELGSSLSYPPILIYAKAPSSASNTSWTNYASVSYQQVEDNLSNNRSAATIYSTPLAPTVSVDNYQYDVGDVATKLSATGTNLQWYDVEIGGFPLPGAPTPSTAKAGTFYYYVSQKNGSCEGPLTKITVVVLPQPDLTIKKTSNSPCAITDYYGNTYTISVSNVGGNKPAGANYTVTVSDVIPSSFTINSASGTGWNVSKNGNSFTFTRNDALNSGNSYPNITIRVTPPSTGTSWVNTADVKYAKSEVSTSNNSSSVTIYATPLPPVIDKGADTIYRKIGSVPVQLEATGTNILWYTTLGGTGSSTAPTPTTDALGTTTYYATQSNGNCVSEKAQVVIKITPTRNLSVDQMVLKGKTAQQVNILSWETLSETNNKGFEIQSSSDATNFEAIGFQKGSGNSNVKTAYSFTDNNPGKVTFYRLKQSDLDGNFAYSNIIRLENIAAQTAVKLYPNPASSYIMVEYDGADLTPFKIFKDNGQLMKVDKTNGLKTRINTQNFTPGNYLIMINGQTIKFTIQK